MLCAFFGLFLISVKVLLLYIFIFFFLKKNRMSSSLHCIVCDFMRTTFEVEYKIKVSKDQIGWGSLDYKFGETVMKVTVEDPSELKTEKEEEMESKR